MMRAVPLRVRDLGLLPYVEAHALQESTLAARVCGSIPDTLLLLEHPAVITLGRGTDLANVKAPGGIPIVPCERGGDVTLHAPGQLVGYVIRKLEAGAGGLHQHMRDLEEVLLRLCTLYGLQGQRHAGATGVWVDGRKIASIGIACRNHVTWHGFALNVNTDLALFRSINPCGFDAAVMTSLQRETGRIADMSVVKRQAGAVLAEVLQTTVETR